jgi:hypothetical protein
MNFAAAEAALHATGLMPANSTRGAARTNEPRGECRSYDPNGFGRDPSDLGDS